MSTSANSDEAGHEISDNVIVNLAMAAYESAERMASDPEWKRATEDALSDLLERLENRKDL